MLDMIGAIAIIIGIFIAGALYQDSIAEAEIPKGSPILIKGKIYKCSEVTP